MFIVLSGVGLLPNYKFAVKLLLSYNAFVVEVLPSVFRKRIEPALGEYCYMYLEIKNLGRNSGSLVLIGYLTFITGGKETQHEVWKYNSSINKWIQIEYLNVGRWRHKMAVLGGKVYVIGGYDGIQRINSVETYDSFHNCWSEVKYRCAFGIDETGNRLK